MLKALLLITVIFMSFSVQAEPILTGGVDYNVQSARQELLQTPVKNPDSFLVAENLIDKNNCENIRHFFKGNVEIKDRTLAFFSDLTYAVMYNNDKYHVWYYSKDGRLIYAEEKDNLIYPYKSYKYTTSGRLINMGLRVSKGETFIYTPDGKLIAHWLKDKAYDENGNVVMTRKYFD